MPKGKSRLGIVITIVVLLPLAALGYFVAQRLAIPMEPAVADTEQSTPITTHITDSAAPLPTAPVASNVVAQPAGPPPPNGLSAQINLLGAQFGGEVGIAVRSIDTGWIAAYRPDDYFPQQSLSKLWVAATVMDKIDSGEIALEEAITLTKSDLSIFHQPIRKKILAQGSHRTTIAKLLRYAMTQSDNTANDALFRRVGGQAGVQNFFASKSISGIRMSKGEKALQMEVSGMKWQDSFSYGRNFWAARKRIPDETRAAAIGAYIGNPVDGATPAAITNGLARLATGDLLSPQSSAYLIDLMVQSKTGPKRLRGGLSAGWSLPHKTGTGQVLKLLATGYNDVGILTSPDGRRYAVAVMIGATNRSVPARQELMHAVVRAVISCSAAEPEC